MRCGVGEMGFIRRNSKGPSPQQRNGAHGEATGRDGAAPEQHGISTGAGRARQESSVFQKLQTKINPIMPCDTGRLATNGVA